jgi:hypothetical protein
MIGGEKLLSGPASRTNQFLTHMLEAALRGCYPMMVGVRRIVANVFLMPAFQVRHPGAVCIHAKTDNLARNPGRLSFHGLHTPILRAFLRPCSYFRWPLQLRQQPLLEVLHSVCYINNEPLEGAQNMEAGNETAAAILVQTIFLKDGHLQGLLGEQATKSPLAAAEFLKPFYRAALAMIAKTKVDDKS